MHSYCDDRGHTLMSVFDHVSDIPGQVNVSTMYAGVVKAWHRHWQQDDYWAVVSGDLKIGLFNTESTSLTAELRLAGAVVNAEDDRRIEVPPSTGRVVYLGEHRPGVLQVPAGLWHGGVATGGRNAVLLYYVTRKFDQQDPDEERQRWDALPFSWGVEFK